MVKRLLSLHFWMATHVLHLLLLRYAECFASYTVMVETVYALAADQQAYVHNGHNADYRRNS